MVVPVLGMIVVLAIVVLIEFPQLKRQNQKKEWWTFAVFFLLAAILSLMGSAGIEVSSPLDWVIIIFKPMNDLFYSLVGGGMA